MNERIEALVDEVEAARWLNPDPGGEELTPEFVAWVEGRVEAFGAALGKSEPTLKAPRCVVTRCAEDLCNRFLTAWSVAANTKESWRFQEALRRANAGRWMESDDEVQEANLALDAALSHSLDRARSLWDSSPVKDPPFMRVARNQLTWLARDDDEPSPWAPLLELWVKGAWPVWLPEGEVLVYVPVLREDRVAWVPDSPTWWELPAVAGELMAPYRMEWSDWKFRQKDALLTIPRYRVAAASEDLLVVFDTEWIHPYVYPLRKDEVFVGRVPGNDVILYKGGVSKRHCAVLRSDNRWFISDMGSAAGTFLNGRKVSDPVLIEPGDRVNFCGFTIRVLCPGEVAVVAGPLCDELAG